MGERERERERERAAPPISVSAFVQLTSKCLFVDLAESEHKTVQLLLGLSKEQGLIITLQ